MKEWKNHKVFLDSILHDNQTVYQRIMIYHDIPRNSRRACPLTFRNSASSVIDFSFASDTSSTISEMITSPTPSAKYRKAVVDKGRRSEEMERCKEDVEFELSLKNF